MRVFVVLLAYACAALMAPLLMMAFGALQEGLPGDFSPETAGVVAGLFATTAAVYALPVALPVIAATEYYRRGDWRIFLGAGGVLGLVLTGLFTPVPFNRVDFGFAAILVPIVTGCVMTYWLVAWKWLAPRTRAEALR